MKLLKLLNWTYWFQSGANDEVTIGKIKGSYFKKDKLTAAQLNHHVHIVGASGFGKTVLISQIIKQQINQGKGLLFLDLKGDISTLQKFSQFAEDAGRKKDLEIFSLTDQDISHRYNILGNGSANQLRDRIMLGLNWSEEYYRNQSSSFLLKLLIGLCWLRDHQNLAVTVDEVLRCTSVIRHLEDRCNEIPEAALRERRVFEDLIHFAKSSENWSSLQGLRTQLESISLSDFGPLVSESAPGIELFESVRRGKINLVFLDSRRYGESAKSIGRFIIQDLKSVSARIDAEVESEKRIPFTVIIDEFADLASDDFIGFLDRARSSKISIVVAHQEVSDLKRVSEEFAARLMGNTSTLYAFLQKQPESAELISSTAGTKTVKESTERHSRSLFFDIPTGEKSVKEVEAFVVHPNIIKSLEVGHCVCVKKYPYAQAYTVKVSTEN